MDVGFVKSRFPWCNNRKRTLYIWLRLDRVFANSKWLSIFPNILVEHLPWLKSDHCPLLIKIGLKSAAFRPFKKERFWLSYYSFLEVVSTSWKQPAWGSPLYRFFSKLKRLKGDLQLWNKYVVGSIFSKIKEAEFQVCDIQKSLERVGWTAELAQEEKEAKNLYDVCLRHSEIRWKKKSRIKWLKERRAIERDQIFSSLHFS